MHGGVAQQACTVGHISERLPQVVLRADRKRGQNWAAEAANLVLALAQKIRQHRLACCGGFTIQGNVQLAHQVGLRVLL